MRILISSLSALSCSFAVVDAAVIPSFRVPALDIETTNRYHIFNAIHSSMRQWGSSLNHNGMSLFVAQVPAGTHFYHGTHSKEPVIGLEWLAFEPEHALNFAAPWPKHPRKPPGDVSWNQPSNYEDQLASSPPSSISLHLADRSSQQHHLVESTSPANPLRHMKQSAPGWMHTYRTKHPLKLLYIDGMSAGKTEKGTLDTQDYLLLNTTDDARKPGFWEGERAQGLCRLAEDRWNWRIQGFIRMEAGFEIILCDFERDVKFLSAVRHNAAPDHDGSDGHQMHHLWTWAHAVAARYDGIGGERVVLDYESFVTGFAYDLDLFQGKEDNLPRLQNISIPSLDRIRLDIDMMIMGSESFSDPGYGQARNWQAVTDMVIERYARELLYLASGALQTSTELYEELERLLQAFVDYDHRDFAAEVSRCVLQMVPSEVESTDSLSARTVRSVTEDICSTLFKAFSPTVDVSHAVQQVQTLVDKLAWTTWKKCGNCPLEKICFIPMWPFGATEDHEHPQCLNATELEGRTGYWGGIRGINVSKSSP